MMMPPQTTVVFIRADGSCGAISFRFYDTRIEDGGQAFRFALLRAIKAKAVVVYCEPHDAMGELLQ